MIDTVALKRRVLELAMTGKLSKYQSGDDKIGDVLNRITKEKEDLLIKRNGRKDNNIKDRAESENDELPENWTWIRFGETGLFKKGPFGSALTKSMFVPKSEDTVKVYEQQHAINKNHTLGTYYITRNYFEDSMSGFEVQSGDVIVSCAGTIGETYVMPEDIEQGIINQALMRVSLIPSIYDKFFLYYFEYGLKKTAQEESNGSAIKNIPPFDVMKNWLFPITSIQEQKRIVENIEEMYQWIDKIDILQTQYSSDLEILKSKIIDAGIQGKLTEQLPEDGTAEELLEQITDEKKLHVKEGKIKASKSLQEITEDEIPFEIPGNWKWVRIADVFTVINGDRGKNYPAKNTLMKEGVIPFISAINIDGHSVVEDDNLFYLSEEQYEKLSSGKMEVDDVIVCIRGSLGKHGLNHFERGAIASSLIICRASYKKRIMALYLMSYLKSGLFVRELRRYNSGVAQPNLAANNFEKFLFPLPPILEQERIVSRIDDAVSMCQGGA